MSQKVTRLEAVTTAATNLMALMEADATNATPENETQFKSLLEEGEKLQKQIKDEAKILGFKSFLDEPAGTPKAAGREPIGGDGADAEPFTGTKSIGSTFVENAEYKAAVKEAGGNKVPYTKFSFEMKGIKTPFERKATFDTPSTGLAGGVVYQPGIIQINQQPLTVADLFAQGETSSPLVNYIQETSYTNNAGMVAEGAEKPEGIFATNAASAPVKKVAITQKVTDETFNDFPMMRDYINNRLVFMVQQKEEQQLVNGTGSGPQITGVLNVSGIQTEAKGGNTAPDAFLNAITKVRAVGFFEPDAIVIHPTDWRNLKELKDLNGQYYGGGPFSTGAYGTGIAMTDMLWGLKVVITTGIPQGTALVGAFKLGGQVFRREGIRVDSTNSNEDDFNFNRISIVVEERLALAIYRPLAFCTVTGL